jgi:hypothetical protein
MDPVDRAFSRRLGLAVPALMILISASVPPAVLPARSDEAFLAVALLKTQLRIERLAADIEKAEAELAANARTIDEAEERMAVAMQTSNRQAKQAPGLELQEARTARRKIKKTLAQLGSERAAAEGTFAVVRRMLEQGESAGPASGILALVSPSPGKIAITRKDGRTIALKPNTTGFLETGDSLSAKGADATGILLLGGRGTVLLDAASRLEIEQDGPQEQVLRLVAGKALVDVESAADLEGQIQDRTQGPDDDLSLILERRLSLAGPDLARLFRKALVMKIPGAVCAVRGTRFSAWAKSDGTAEIDVLEGAVDVADPGDRKPVVVEEGFRAIVTKDGISVRPIGRPIP